MLLAVTYMASLLGSPWSHSVTFFNRLSMLLTCPLSWNLYCIFGFILTVSCIAFSGAAPKDSDLGTHYLSSQTFLWNLSGTLHDPGILTNSACLQNQYHIDELPPPWAVVSHLWILVTLTTECLGIWTHRNSSPCWPCVNRGSISNELTLFHTWPYNEGVSLVPGMSSRYLSHCPSENY
jgi:hypothetical protein